MLASFPQRGAHRSRPTHPTSRRMARTWSVASAMGLLGLVLAAIPAIARDPQNEVERLITQSPVAKATIGVSVVDLRTGQRLVAINDDLALIPASNMKLLTTGAALSVLGPDFVFRTELIQAGSTVVLVGSGDPSLGDPRMLELSSSPIGVEDMLDALASSVAKAGMTRVDEIIVDDRIFERRWVHPGWPADQLDRHYAAAVAGVNFHLNVLDFYPAPGPGAGTRASFELEPRAPWIAREVQVRALTSTTGRHTPWVRRDATRNAFTLLGEVKHAAQTPIRIAVHDAPLFAGQLLASRIVRYAGVGPAGSGPTNAVRLAAPDEQIRRDRVLAVVTTPLVDIVARCNRDSVNLYAEALLKRIGHEVTGEPGSWGNGGAVLRMVLADRLGPNAATSTVISDGSGLSRANRVRPATMTRWLGNMRQDPAIGDLFVGSLATTGQGTLRKRFPGTTLKNTLRAKSGTINGVRCLSGYLIHPTTGRTLVFSILINDLPLSGGAGPQALRLHESIVATLDIWLSANPGIAIPTVPNHATAGEPG